MGDFFAELKQRHVYRVAAAYAVVAWVVIQLVNNLTPMLNLPNAVGTTVLVLLAAGFPIALIFAWVRELPPAAETGTPLKATAADWALIGVLFAVLGAVTYQQFAPTQSSITPAKQPGVEQERLAADKSAGVSVAVLPFVNLSSDKEQEFFSDGMTEEITTALAKVPDLRVVGRTSAFQFKGENKDLRAIGQALSATHLIEGSVRKAGNRVRVTAQLIKANDGTHVWAEDYDRDLTDVFAIQEDIARAITASLHMTLGLKPGENLVNNRKIDPESYTEYLRIKAGVAARVNAQTRAQGVAGLEKLLARQPDFAPAWAYLAQIRVQSLRDLYASLWTRPVEQTRDMADKLLQQAESNARDAIRLDATQAVAYSVLAEIETGRRNWANAEDLLKKALQLDANNPDVLLDQAQFLLLTGRVSDALKLVRESDALDPFSPRPAIELASLLFAKNEIPPVIELLKTRPFPLARGRALLIHAYAATGQFQEAADGIGAIPRTGANAKALDAAEAVMRALAAKKPPPKVFSVVSDFNWIFAYSGQPERLMEGPERSFQAGLLARGDLIFDGSLAPVQKTERFKKYLRDTGRVNYWRMRGWPEVCHPVGTDDFACE